MEHKATYSPEDNKLRLYPASRLDKETYTRARAAGFIWAPKQGIFVAPMWTPGREDFLVELCGEIGDEDTSLVERAEDRAERFEDYSDKRASEALQAKAAADKIADGIPLGQPILIGHHSEKHARRDAEKIENGIRKAVKLWKTSEYWTERAKGAIRAAKYKELPAVRARRIKGLESDRRKLERNLSACEGCIKAWEKVLTFEGEEKRKAALFVANTSRSTPMGTWSDLNDGKITPEAAAEKAISACKACIENITRWIEHTDNRLSYERAMLAEAGGTVADRTGPEKGGACQCWASPGRYNGGWSYIVKVNKVSVTVLDNWGNAADKDGSHNFTRTIPFDKLHAVMTAAEVQALRESGRLIETTDKVGFFIAEKPVDPTPTPEGDKAAPEAAPVGDAPLCNFPGNFHAMTKADYRDTHRDFKGTRIIEATATHGRYRVRTAIVGGSLVTVYLSDSKRVDPPAKAPAPKPEVCKSGKGKRARPFLVDPAPVARAEAPAEIPGQSTAEQFAQMEQTLKAGVQVIAAPQLFPTPPDLARRVVELAEVQPGQSVLEPSAGTGALIQALRDVCGGKYALTAVEINSALCDRLQNGMSVDDIRRGDFLAMNGNLGSFDRIVMNPPFENGADIKHICHAIEHLNPGGRLVAICANGPRQREQLRPLAAEWIDLPAGSFKAAGTNVNAAVVVINA